MAEKDSAERTEQPTPRRLGKAKEKGQVPQSEELTSFVAISILTAMTAFSWPSLMRWFRETMQQGLTRGTGVFSTTDAFVAFVNENLVDMGVVMLPTLAALCIGGVAASVIVGGGFNFAPGAVRFDLETLNPASGIGRLFNGRNLVKLGLSIVKLLFVGLIVWTYLSKKLGYLASLRWVWTAQLLGAMGHVLLGLVIRMCLALLVVGLVDTAYQKWKWMKDLKMTKQEVKEERKQTEGAPETRSRIRKIQIEGALRRMRQEVPKASVVLVNPTHYAVALKYDAKRMEAPVVVAKGADEVAFRIMEVARAYGVPIVRRPELARTLFATVRCGQFIPDSLFVAVAEVLALIYRLRQRRLRRH